MSERAAKKAQDQFSRELMSYEGVVGTGIRELGDGEVCIAVYMKSTDRGAKDALPTEVSVRIDGREEKVKVEVVNVGPQGFSKERL